MSDSEDPSSVPTLHLKASVQDAIHNAKFARTEIGRLEFLRFAVSTQLGIIRREAVA